MKISVLEYLSKIHDVIVEPNDYGQISVYFKNGYIKDGPGMVAVCGHGETVEEAAADYYNFVVGKCIIIDDPHDRREIYLYKRNSRTVDNVRRLWYNERKKEAIMEGKNERIYIRVSAEELEQIKEKAAARHLSVSAYIRMIVLAEKEEVKA